MKKILVTGAGGYIGTTLVPLLVQNDFSVRAYDRFFFGDALLENQNNIEKLYGDIRNLEKHLFDGIHAVIDLAALSNDPSGELFQNSTLSINHKARVAVANLAKECGVKQYILPSSCSIYGFQEEGVIADENSLTNPLTTYAKANFAAENDVLKLADKNFTVTVLRQATVYGYSPRMRFDLAINGMTYGAWNDAVLPLMRDGTQWRPMVHVKDTSLAMLFMLNENKDNINGEIFNVGSDKNNYQIGDLAERVASQFENKIEIQWYGDPDHRSYRVNFDKLHALGFKTKFSAEDGVEEIKHALDSGLISKDTKSITLEWYKELVKWNEIISKVQINNKIIDL